MNKWITKVRRKQENVPKPSSASFWVLKSPFVGITDVTKGSKAQCPRFNQRPQRTINGEKRVDKGKFVSLLNQLLTSLVSKDYTQRRTTRKTDKIHNMIIVRTLGLCILMTLLIGKTIAQGNVLLQAENGKGQEIKTADKRVDNFRVPVDTSFDPNFWPARGRRGGVGGVTYDNPISPEGNTIWDRNNFQCQKRYYLPDVKIPRNQREFDNSDVNDYRNTFLENFAEDCYDLPRRPGQLRSLKVCKTKLKNNPSVFDTGDFIWLLTNKTEGKRHKQQRYREIPPWFNSEYFLVKPDSSNGEKEKKQDVFWVARGKKSFQ